MDYNYGTRVQYDSGSLHHVPHTYQNIGLKLVQVAL